MVIQFREAYESIEYYMIQQYIVNMIKCCVFICSQFHVDAQQTATNKFSR